MELEQTFGAGMQLAAAAEGIASCAEQALEACIASAGDSGKWAPLGAAPLRTCPSFEDVRDRVAAAAHRRQHSTEGADDGQKPCMHDRCCEASQTSHWTVRCAEEGDAVELKPALSTSDANADRTVQRDIARCATLVPSVACPKHTPLCVQTRSSSHLLTKLVR